MIGGLVIRVPQLNAEEELGKYMDISLIPPDEDLVHILNTFRGKQYPM